MSVRSSFRPFSGLPQPFSIEAGIQSVIFLAHYLASIRAISLSIASLTSLIKLKRQQLWCATLNFHCPLSRHVTSIAVILAPLSMFRGTELVCFYLCCTIGVHFDLYIVMTL